MTNVNHTATDGHTDSATSRDSVDSQEHIDSPPLSWFALHVRAQTEHYTAAMFTRKGYECFLPTHLAESPRPIQRHKHELALFPGYVFCRFDVLKRLPILVTPGVMGVVGTGRMLAALDDSEILSIQEAVRRRHPVNLSQPGRSLVCPPFRESRVSHHPGDIGCLFLHRRRCRGPLTRKAARKGGYKSNSSTRSKT